MNKRDLDASELLELSLGVIDYLVEESQTHLTFKELYDAVNATDDDIKMLLECIQYLCGYIKVFTIKWTYNGIELDSESMQHVLDTGNFTHPHTNETIETAMESIFMTFVPVHE